MRYGCQQCREEVSVRPAEALGHLARARLAAHLAACPSCRAFNTRFQATMEAARGWAPALTDAGRSVILDRVCAQVEPARARRRWRGAAIWLPAAAALAALLLLRSRAEVARPTSAPGVLAVADRVPPAEAPPREFGPGPRSADAPAGAAGKEPAGAPSPRRVRRGAEPTAGGTTAAGAPQMPIELARPPSRSLPDPARARSLYQEAERAMAEERPAGAARILEELVEEQPDTAEAQAARLELGRLYAGPLAHQARAVEHLSAFVAREQEPGVRGAARGLLCRLLPPGERERACWPGLAALGKQE